jgi:homocysteine S-methyltransferase
VGPVACLDALERMGRPGAGEPARSIMPNAGLPQRQSGRFVYAAPPDYFGSFVPGLLAAGARIVGGCCGTTPEHIAAMRAALEALDTADARRAGARATGTQTGDRTRDAEADAGIASISAGRPRATLAERAGDQRGATGDAPPPTGLARALADRRYVVSVEIDPPRSVRIERTIAAAQLLKDAGVDLVNVSGPLHDP